MSLLSAIASWFKRPAPVWGEMPADLMPVVVKPIFPADSAWLEKCRSARRLSLTQTRVLQVIAEECANSRYRDCRIGMIEIARRAGAHSPDVCVLASDMERRGLIKSRYKRLKRKGRSGTTRIMKIVP